jgi:hypothetical protein
MLRSKLVAAAKCEKVDSATRAFGSNAALNPLAKSVVSHLVTIDDSKAGLCSIVQIYLVRLMISAIVQG